MTDLALGVVLAYWVQHTIDGPVHVRPRALTADPGSGRRSGSASRASRISGSVPLASRSNVPSASRRTLVVSLVVPIVVAVVVVVAIAFPSQLAGWMQAFPSQVGNAGQLWPSLLPFLFVAIMVGTFLVMAPASTGTGGCSSCPHRSGRPGRIHGHEPVRCRRGPVLAIGSRRGPPSDVGLFRIGFRLGGQLADEHGGERLFAGSVGRTGRFAIFDPLLIGGFFPSLVGQPDLNIQAGQYSAQGYSAIVETGMPQPQGPMRPWAKERMR